MNNLITRSLRRGAIAVGGLRPRYRQKLGKISAWFLAFSLVITPVLPIGSTVANANGLTADSFAVFGAGDNANSNTTQLGKNVQVSGGMVGSNRSVYMSAGSSAPGVRAGADATLGGSVNIADQDNDSDEDDDSAVNTSVVANREVTIKKDGSVTGSVDGNSVYLGDTALVTGNVVSGSSIVLVKEAKVDGDVDAQTAELRKDTEITGTLTLPDGIDPSGTGYPADTTIGTLNNVGTTPLSPANFTKITLPTANTYSASSNSGDDFSVGNGDTEDWDPGTYRDISFAKNATVNMSAGYYVIRKLSGSDDLTLNIDLSGGPVIIFAEQDVHFGKHTQMLLSGGDATSIYIETAGRFLTGSGSTIYGTVYSTKSNSAGQDGISIGNSNNVYGALYSGQQVGIAADTNVTMSGPYWGAPLPTTGSLKVTKTTVNGDGTFEFTGDAGDFSITTTENSGSETISELEPGTYSVTEENLEEGWTETSNTCVDVEVVAGETAECTIENTYEEPSDPGVDPEGKNVLNLSGTKFNNRNEDRDRDEGEEGLEGWEMRLYVEGDEGWELVATDITESNGAYKFPAQQNAGVYHVCEVAQLGWHQVKQNWSGTQYHVATDNLSPNASEEGPYCTEINYTDEADRSNKKQIGNALNDPNDEHQFTQSGIKFHNTNGDRDRDEGEEVLEGWEMRLYVEGDEGWELIDTDVTDENGVYKFKQQKSAGVYHVCEVLQEDWEQVRQDWSGTPYHIVTDNISPNFEEEGPYCSTVTYTDEADRSNKKYFGNRYVPVEPTSSEVTLCKLNDSETPLSGWTVMLRGEEIETLSVPSENSVGVDSSSLSSGVWHIFKAFGTWLNDRSAGENHVDAEYSTIDEWDTYMDGFTGYGENILDLQVDENFVDWGNYSDTHEYAMSYLPSVDGSVNFRIFDGQNDEPIDSWYSDNSGSLSVSLSTGYVGVTGQDGCVTFTEVPFGNWFVDELLQTGWENVSGLGEVTVENGIHEFYVVNKLADTNNGGGSNGGGDEPVIKSYKWNDANFDGERGDEDWLENWRIALARVVETEETETVPVEIVAMSLTDSNGLAQFSIPEEGDYVLIEEIQDGWLNTAPVERETPLSVSCDQTLSDLATCEETEWHVDSFFDIAVPGLVNEDITVDNEENALWFGNYQSLIISEETASEIETESATITWLTDKPGTSRVVYDTVSHDPLGSAPNYGYAFSTTEDPTKVTDHSVLITGLTPGQTYYYRVISSASPEVVSQEHDFTTTSNGNVGNGSSGGSSGGGGGGGVILLSTPTGNNNDGGGNGDSGNQDSGTNPPGRIAGVTDEEGGEEGNGGESDDSPIGTGGPSLIAGGNEGGQVLGETDDSGQDGDNTGTNETENGTDESIDETIEVSTELGEIADTGDDCYRILTICWYWWLLLILILLALYYYWLTTKEDKN